MKVRFITTVCMGLILITGCQPGDAFTPTALEATPTHIIEPESTLTATPSPTPLEPPSATPSSTPSSTPSPTQPPQELSGADLPLPLYFLSDQSIWLLEPGDTIVERITPSDWEIMGFDVRAEDGRIAYGTSGGQLYAMMPGQEPQLLHDVNAEASYSTAICCVSWSPDGTRLAYSVSYTSSDAYNEAGYPSYPSGLWLLDVGGMTPTWLLSNHYLSEEQTDTNATRSLADPVWSPDGTALMMTGQYWEWKRLLLLDPVAPDVEEANLRELTGGWGRGSWASDSQSMLLSSQINTDIGGLDQMDRASLEVTPLIDGESEGVWVGEAQELPSGIAFLMGQLEAWLYLGHRSEEGFEYAPVGSERLCSSGNPGYIEWDSTAQWGVLVCEYGPKSGNEQDEVHIVTLDGENIDITPYLSPLADAGSPKVLWGK